MIDRVKKKLATLVESDPTAPFSIATTQKIKQHLQKKGRKK